MPGDVPAGKKHGFSQGQRLKLGWEFETVRREGSRLVKGCLVLNFRPNPEQKWSRLGVITSRKIGNAVVRSRARRLMREAFRLHQGELKKAADLILIARQSIREKQFQGVEKDFLWLVREAGLWAKPATEGLIEQGGG